MDKITFKVSLNLMAFKVEIKNKHSLIVIFIVNS